MSFARFLLAALIAALPTSLLAELTLPAGASLRYDEVKPSDTYALPVGAHTGNALPTIRTAGAINRQAWRLGGTGLSSYQIILGLRQQLLDQGFDILFECDETACGGYDFRLETEVIAEPDMHLDLGNYQFLSAHNEGDGAFTSLLVSRSASAGFVQIISVQPQGLLPGETVTSTKAAPETAESATLSVPAIAMGAIGTAMEAVGRYVLSDLDFETGSATLAQPKYASLDELAGYLTQHPEKRVALVGHTDAEGSLTANIAISERRAAAVMTRLTNELGVPAGQLEARGIGYLAPIASNQSEAGRTQNRRVEAILISTE